MFPKLRKFRKYWYLRMPEPIENQYVRVGRIVKAHGLDGAVVIIPEVNVASILESGELVRLQSENGDLVPARIETSQIQQKKGRQSYVVKFDHITDRNQARQLRKMPVFVSRERVDQIYDQQSFRRLISFSVRNVEGPEVGIVGDVLDNPAHPILVVKIDDKDVLVPLVGEYVVDIDEDEEIVYCQKLNQLADIS